MTKSRSEDIANEKAYENKMNRFLNITESMKNQFAANENVLLHISTVRILSSGRCVIINIIITVIIIAITI